jgi:F0F1-type ATP synthase assembly protein I
MDDRQPAEPGDQDHPPEPSPPLGPAAVAFLTLGVAWAAALAAGWGIGYLVDRWAGTSPIFMLVGLAFGAVLAVLMTIVRVRKYL